MGRYTEWFNQNQALLTKVKDEAVGDHWLIPDDIFPDELSRDEEAMAEFVKELQKHF